MTNIDLKQYIREIPDFPKPGILFRDITPLLAAPHAFQHAIDLFAEHYRNAKIDSIIAAESRGFIFAAPLALALQASFVPVRKPASCLTRSTRIPTTSSTVAIHSRCIPTRSNPVSAYW